MKNRIIIKNIIYYASILAICIISYLFFPTNDDAYILLFNVLFILLILLPFFKDFGIRKKTK